MVIIKKFENVIPVDFGEFELEFILSDENIKKLESVKNRGKDLTELVNNLKGEIGDLEKIYNSVKELYLDLFTEEDFEKVYKVANNSSVTALLYFLEIVKGLSDELGNKFAEDKLVKYLEA